MGAPTPIPGSNSQWLFPISALQSTPSQTTSAIPLEKELYDRSRGVEFLYRLGVSLGLPSSAMFTAATWFHRFYMRFSMEDYHRQDVAASCIFLATKTEECGRKLRDVAKVVCSKIQKVDIGAIPDDSKDVEECQASILLTEEVLLEALCFDFVVDCPHAELVSLFEAHSADPLVEECAWSIANDSYRTPLCVLYTPKVVAAACYVLAQHAVEGPQALSLNERIASPAPSASLPTPPSHKPSSPQESRFAVEYFGFNETELVGVADALSVMLEYYGAQELQGSSDFLVSVASASPPSNAPHRESLYKPFAHVAMNGQAAQSTAPNVPQGETVSDGHTSSQTTPSKAGWKPVTGAVQ